MKRSHAPGPQPKLTRTQLARLKFNELRALLPKKKLDDYGHSLPDEGVCLMEAVAWVSGEEHSDHPTCSCPVLTAIGIEMNDSGSDKSRQALIQAIPALVGSKTKSKLARFRRVRRAYEFILAHAIDGLNSNRHARSRRPVLTIEAFVYDRLKAMRDQRLTKEGLGFAIEAFAFIRDNASDLYTSADCDKLIDLLKEFVGEWDSRGISRHVYEGLLSCERVLQFVPESTQADFLIEVATQHG